MGQTLLQCRTAQRNFMRGYFLRDVFYATTAQWESVSIMK